MTNDKEYSNDKQYKHKTLRHSKIVILNARLNEVIRAGSEGANYG